MGKGISIKEEKINGVFENRAEYEKKRYISRSRHETDLRRSINRFRYVFVTGESGCGKTWLTKNVLSTDKRKNQYINLSEVVLSGGLMEFFKNSISEVKTERTETKSAEASTAIISGSLEVTNTYHINNDILWGYLSEHKKEVIVLDNFESIITNQQMVNDLSCLITLADDPRMIDFDIRFLIIGALQDVVKYFQMMANYQTIANRIDVVSIYGFNDTECYDFVSNGFTECGFKPIEYAAVSKRIFTLTGGVPQTVNDLCYYIALKHFDENAELLSLENIRSAEVQWVHKRMFSEYSVINGYFTENVRGEVSNNYILYALQHVGSKEFSSSGLLYFINEDFGEKSKSVNLKRVQKYLDVLSDDGNNRNILIKTNPDGYKIKTYKTGACLNAVLYIDDKDAVCCVDDWDCAL